VSAGGPPAEARTPYLAARGISKRFGGVEALKAVDFEVYPGECVGLMGDNGAGKSTLIKILTGLYQADEGTVTVEGRTVEFTGPDDSRRAGVEVVFQDLALCDNLDAAANFFLGREETVGWGPFRFLRKRRMAAMTNQYVSSVGVTLPDPRAPVGAYSGGQRQALAFARAIRGAARLLVLDEPTAALGVRERTEVIAAINRLRRERGVSVILITHNIEELRALADRVVVLRRGQRVGHLDVATASSEDVVALITGARSG
jgi:ABC-type sugar transport system ATPase subunit